MTSIDAAALKKAEEFIEQEEGATHHFKGAWGRALLAVAVAMSLFHLYAAYGNVTTNTLRYVHVAFALFLGFALFPAAPSARGKFSIIDLALAMLGVSCIAWAVIGARGGPPHNGLDHACRVRDVYCLRHAWSVVAIALDAQRLRHQSLGGHHVHDPRRGVWYSN
jgi:hypothetical protein